MQGLLNLKQCAPLAGILAFYALLIYLFPLKLNTVESYAYAAAIDGHYDLATTFQATQPDVTLPNFARYHPNHPLAHLLAGILHDAFNIPGLTLFRFFNAVGSLFCLIFFYLTCKRLWGHTAVCIAATLLMAFSHVYWLLTLSAEIHLPAMAFLMAAVYFFVRYFDEEQKRENRYLIIAAVMFSFSLAFHFGMSFVIIPATLAILRDGRFKEKWPAYLAVFAIIMGAFFLFYALLLVHFLKIQSGVQFLRTLFIYDFFVAQKAYFGWEQHLMMIKTFLHSVSFHFTPLSTALKIGYGIFFLVGYILVARAKLAKPLIWLIVGWPVTYLLILVLMYGRTDTVNGWIFILPSVCMASAAVFNFFYERPETRLYLCLFPATLAIVNFTSVILPNRRLTNQDYLYLGDPQAALRTAGSQKLITKDEKIAIYIKDPGLTFPEVTSLTTDQGYKNITIFMYCPAKPDEIEKLRTWIHNTKSFLLFTDGRFEDVEGILKTEKKKVLPIKDASGTIPNELLPSSVFFPQRAGYAIPKRLRGFLIDPV